MIQVGFPQEFSTVKLDKIKHMNLFSLEHDTFSSSRKNKKKSLNFA